LDVPRDLPPVHGDSSQIHQVVMNLIINAAEAIGGGQSGEVAVAAGVRHLDAAAAHEVSSGLTAGRWIFISVRDSGCGMDEETKARIFDPFFTTKFTGRGLGLAAVQGILRAHKGAITVESQPGNGSTLTVYLPCSVPAPAVSAVPKSGLPKQAAITVLVVDDEEAVRTFMKAALQRLGHRALLAEDGRQALDLLRTNDVDLVLLDIVMPVMGGPEAFAEMRAKWPRLAILVASGYNREEARRLGIPDDLPFLDKPYTLQALGRAIEKALVG
jgi:CheY-like chemotaxis protein